MEMAGRMDRYPSSGKIRRDRISKSSSSRNPSDIGEIVSALKEIGYGGYFTLEADAYLKKYAKDDVCKGVKKMAESAKRLAAMFEKESL